MNVCYDVTHNIRLTFDRLFFFGCSLPHALFLSGTVCSVLPEAEARIHNFLWIGVTYFEIRMQEHTSKNLIPVSVINFPGIK